MTILDPTQLRSYLPILYDFIVNSSILIILFKTRDIIKTSNEQTLFLVVDQNVLSFEVDIIVVF